MEDSINLKIKRIHKLPNNGAIKAFVDLCVNDAFLIKGLRIVDGPRGLFVTMPQDKGKNDRWYNTVDCLSPNIRSVVTDFVLAAYKQDNN